MDLAAHLQHLEEQLLDPAVRNDPTRLDALLTDDFREFGSSGRSYTKAEIIALLQEESAESAEPAEPAHPVTLSLSDFTVRLLAPAIALATYTATRTNQRTGETTHSLRSSLWILRNDRWQLHFHQGTRVP
jgi:hypothetical protein